MGKTLADGYLELRLDPSKLNAETTAAFRKIGFKQKGEKAGEEAGEGFAKKANEKINSGLGKGLAAFGIGAGIAGALGSGIKSALDVGAANDKLRAQLGLNATDSARLGKVAGQLYASNYGDSMEEVNDAIANVVRNIPSLRNASVPVLKEISAGALDISRVFGQDVEKTTAAVSSMLKSGIAPNAKAALDILTKGFQSGANKADDLLDTFTEYSGQFKKLGLDGPASLGVINELLAGGARNSDLAADAIKEFSIRAIDGSKTTIAGYKLLNLDADKFAQTIAKGGPAAKEAFGTVVDRINSIKDPVKRNTAGVDLFGTKFEDLGNAFKHLDVGAATDGLGKVAGATAKLATQSDSSKIQGFIRTVQTGFVSVIGGQVIPAVTRFAAANKDQLTGALNSAKNAGQAMLPTLKGIANVVVDKVIPAVSSVVGFFKEHATVTKVLAGIIAATVVGIQAYAVYTKAAAFATTAWSVAVKIAGAATKVWAGIQAAFNFVMSANPIGLVVLAIGALVAAVIIAYKNSETFRNIVQGAWKGIQAAVSFAWNNVIKPAVQAMVKFWNDVIAPAAKFLWHNVIEPVFKGISFAVNAAWVIIQIALKAFKLYLDNVIIPVVKFLYNNVIKPVFNAAGTLISAWWNKIVKPEFNAAKAGFEALGKGLAWVWNNVVKPMFKAFGGFITGSVVPAFKAGVDGIKGAWAKIQEAARKPVAFVVNKIINPFIGGINSAAQIVGVKDRIPKISGFARGGRIPGAPSAVDDRLASGPGGLPIKVASGEFIVNAADTAKALPLLRWVNDGMKGGMSRVASYLGRPLTDYPGDGSEGWAFKDGGLVGWVKDVWGALADPAALIKKPFNNLLGQIPGGGVIRDFLVGAGRRMLDGATDWLGSFGGESGTFSKHVAGRAGAARQFVMAQNGKPYVWASAGPGGYDCSGIVSAAYNILRGRGPYSHTFSTESAGSYFSRGQSGPLMAGWSHPGQSPASASVGHMAGQIAGMPFESRGSRGVIVGNGARRIGQFANVGAAHFARGGQVPVFDRGGTLMPGMNTVYNGLGRPEALRRADLGGGDLHVHIHDSVIASDRAAEDLFVKAYRSAKLRRRIP